MTIRALFYDAGYTLVRATLEASDIWEFLARHLGVDLERERKLPNVGHYYYIKGMGKYDSDERARNFWSDYYVRALTEANVDLPREALVSASDALYDWYQKPEQWELYPDSLETLRRGHDRGLAQGVISDWGTDLVSLLHAHDVTQHLDFVVASAAVGAAKPHPEIFRYALDRAGFEPAEVIYVGDSYISDVLGARAVGISPVLLDRDGDAPTVDCPVINSLFELLDLIDE